MELGKLFETAYLHLTVTFYETARPSPDTRQDSYQSVSTSFLWLANGPEQSLVLVSLYGNTIPCAQRQSFIKCVQIRISSRRHNHQILELAPLIVFDLNSTRRKRVDISIFHKPSASRSSRL